MKIIQRLVLIGIFQVYPIYSSTLVVKAPHTVSVKQRYEKDPRRAWRMSEIIVKDIDHAVRTASSFTAVQKLFCDKLLGKLEQEMNILYRLVLEQYQHQPLVLNKLKNYQHAWEQFVYTQLQLTHPGLPYGNVINANFEYYKSYLQHLCQHIDFLLSFLIKPHSIYPVDDEIERNNL